MLKKNNVIVLAQPARRGTPRKENLELTAPDVYRAIGTLEAMASNLKQAVDSLTKAQAENNVLTAQIVTKLDGIGKDLHGASTTAKAALARADAAHDRIDRLVWTASGAGMAAGAVIGFFSDKLAAAWRAIMP